VYLHHSDSCSQTQHVRRFIHICLNVRIVAAEIGGTLGFVFLIVFGAVKAWQEFIVKLFQ